MGPTRMPRPSYWRLAASAALGLLLASCAPPVTVRPEPPPPETRPEVRPPVPVAPARVGVVARSGKYLVVRTRKGDTARSLAQRYLGDADRYWVIEDFNDTSRFSAGTEAVIPLASPNPVGVHPDGYQTVPILCYHRFGSKAAKMVVTPEAFAEQMGYLAEHGYRVVPLTDLVAFLEGRQPLPRRAVVITMDDGYRSNYQYAFPELERHGFPATIFVYTDFLGGGAALRTNEMREMLASGLVDIQPHSKAHSNLALRAPDEDQGAYGQRVEQEIDSSSRHLERLLGVPIHTFAYPYGDTNDLVIHRLEDSGFRLGATVQSGGNPAFAYPYMLRRTMVYGEDDLETFRGKLEVFQRTATQ